NNLFFTDVTEEAGIKNFGLTLSATISDFNLDGLPDVYVSNDFNSPDFFYINNGNGTFTDRLSDFMNHTANFGMGADAADINNDGYVDLLQLDMKGDNNKDRKTNMSSMAPEIFYEAVDLGLHHQYMRNNLQLNNGNGTFSDVAELAGLSNTNWSWGPLIADLNNDGWKDIFITNGIRRNVNNNDFIRFQRKVQQYKALDRLDYYRLINKMPVTPVDNYVFVNHGDLTFQTTSKNWGLSYKGFSHGAAYADFDGDGDLDIVINNMNDKSLLFENHTTDSLSYSNFIRVKLKGNADNKFGLGTKVTIKSNGEEQFQELTSARGYLSTSEPILHFGLRGHEKVDEMQIIWPNGTIENHSNIKINKLLEFVQKAENKIGSIITIDSISPLFTDSDLGIFQNHQENTFDDFSREVLLPHMMSRHGPSLSVADVDGNGYDDIHLGGAMGQSAALYLQDSNGKFHESPEKVWSIDKAYEDVSSLFFDADGDGDQDLYVVSGGNERKESDTYYQDRLYINNGKGNFSKSQSSLPTNLISGSRARACDYDKDGDMDLFIGGRQAPGQYPLPASSILLRNDSKGSQVQFTDVTTIVAPMLKNIGMVTDANWADVNNDGLKDLVVVGEWMPITILINEEGVFEDATNYYGLSEQTGWWSSIISGDFDKDGDIDLIGGNLGLNYKYKATKNNPFEIYASDFDANGSLDIALGYYEDGELYPLRGRQCSSQQIPKIKSKFPTYESFAKANFTQVYNIQDSSKVKHLSAKTFATTYFENTENGYVAQQLDNRAQISSTNVILVSDYNQDGYEDLLLAGNLYTSEVETPRNDAGYGELLIGDGAGNFIPQPPSETGLMIRGEVREAQEVKLSNGTTILLFGRNNDSIKALKLNIGKGN
ncbi:MAG: VCBS repeat-containing protein, partial [Bacteroidetes bacterium]|nr:VCBS repeat-containing protein [Bacteroidota bacterium]